MSSSIDFTSGPLPVTKRGFMYQTRVGTDAGVYNVRVSAFLKPKTHAGKFSYGCSLYFNAHPVGVDPSKKNIVGSPVQVYCGRDGVLKSSAGDRRPDVGRFMEAFFGVGLGETLSEEAWWHILMIVNGARCSAMVAAMGAFDLRAAYAQMVGGVTGAKYPKTEDMRQAFYRQLKHDGAADRSAVLVSIVDGLSVLGGGESAEVGIMPMKDETPAPASDLPADPKFNPDAMTHGDLVDLARMGHNAAVEIDLVRSRHRREHDRANEAETARDAAIAERDAAVKRAEMVAPVKTSVVTGDGTVEIEGVTLPSFEGGHGPTPIDGYDLAAWQAVVEVGDFTATASAPQVAASIMAGDSVRLVGPPSVGKTSGIREVCAHTGAKFFLIPCGEGATDLSLIAERVIGNGGEFVWRDGHVTQAVRWAIANPGVVCIAVLDEVDHLVPEVQSLMHSVLEGDTLVVSPEETLTVPSNIRFVATANTSGLGDISGHHASAKVSDTAFTSRWNATFTVTYLPADAETRLLVGAGAPPEQAEQAVRCAGMTRVENSTVTQPVVLRQLLAWARACGRGEDPRSAWAWRVMTATPEHDRHALRELTRTCFNW
jgi:MoxR-like ATPase